MCTRHTRLLSYYCLTDPLIVVVSLTFDFLRVIRGQSERWRGEIGSHRLFP